MRNYYKSGSWNVICQVCGKQYKSDQVRKRWDGLIVCDEDFEQRHILDFIRVPAEDTSVPYASPDPTDTFVPDNACPFPTVAGMADIGTANCAVAGLNIHIPEIVTLGIAGIAIAGSFTPAEDFF